MGDSNEQQGERASKLPEHRASGVPTDQNFADHGSGASVDVGRDLAIHLNMSTAHTPQKSRLYFLIACDYSCCIDSLVSIVTSLYA